MDRIFIGNQFGKHQRALEWRRGEVFVFQEALEEEPQATQKREKVEQSWSYQYKDNETSESIYTLINKQSTSAYARASASLTINPINDAPERIGKLDPDDGYTNSAYIIHEESYSGLHRYRWRHTNG